MTRLAGLLLALALAAVAAHASDPVSLGYSDQTVVIGPGPDACAGGILIHNHDGSFENAYAWQYGGQRPPYYGAFGEGYNLGRGMVWCAVCWLTRGGDYPATGDCYVWAGGFGAEPGEVLALVSGVDFDPYYWPMVTQYDVEMNLAVDGPFTVGCWGDWPGHVAAWYCAADLDGPGGHPWTCIAPGLGYPSGWRDPSIVWPAIRSMGFGAYFEQSTSVSSETWGAIKAMFRE